MKDTVSRALALTMVWCGLACAAPAPTQKNPAPRPAAPEAAPNAAASAAPAAAPAERQPVDVDPQSLQPYNLPPASRAKMRACGEEWRDMKLAGAAGGWTWKTFAEKCLVK